MGWLAACLVAALAGCDRDVGTLSVFISRSSLVQEDPLDPALVKYLRIRVEGPGMGVETQTFAFEFGGSSSPPPVPVGKDRVISVEGLAGKDGPVVSRGESLPMPIVAGDNDLQLYMGLTGRFSSAAGTGLNEARFGHTVTVLTDGQALVAGGASGGTLDAPTSPVVSVEDFDPTSGSIVGSGDCQSGGGLCLRSPRADAAALGLGDAVLLVGGRDDAGPVASLERCSLAGCALWGTLPSPRWSPGFARGGPWVVGGTDANGASTAVDELGANGHLKAAPALPEARSGAAVAVAGDGSLVVLGGDDGTGTPLAGGLRLPSGASTFQVVDPGTTTARSGGAAVTLADGRVLFIGGQDAGGTVSDEIDLYDPASNLLCPVGVLVRARFDLAAVRMRDGRVLVAGGLTATGEPTAEVEILDTRFVPQAGSCQGLADTLTSTSAPQMAHRRAGHAVALLPNGLVMVTGGIDETGKAERSIELFVPSS